MCTVHTLSTYIKHAFLFGKRLCVFMTLSSYIIHAYTMSTVDI